MMQVEVRVASIRVGFRKKKKEESQSGIGRRA
jgi:hypothetical protein